MSCNPYLFFDGTCAEAFRFYATVLHTTIDMMMTHGESPMAAQSPPGMADRVMHARLTYDGTMLMGSDSMPGMNKAMQGFAVSLQPTDVAEAERLFAALAEGGEIRMPIAETFWAKRFGMVTDRFGTPWMINCETPA